jgi:hypothetical protein
MANDIYNSFMEYVCDGTIDLDDHSFKIMLLADTYTPSATHSVKADVSSHEITGAGYTAGGQALSGLTWTRSGDVCTLDATDPTWTSATFTARYAVIYDDTPTSPADPLVMLYDFGTNKSCSNGAFTVNVSASGFLSLTKVVP